MSTIGPSIGKIPEVPSTPPEGVGLSTQLSKLTELFLDTQQNIKSQLELNKKLGDKASEPEMASIQKNIKEIGKKLKKTSKEIENIADQIRSEKNFTEEDISLIFKIENQLREILEISPKFSAKDKYQDIYDLTIIPMIKRAKTWIKKRPINASSETTASKGKSLQAGLRAIERHSKNVGQSADTEQLERDVRKSGYESATFHETPVLEKSKKLTYDRVTDKTFVLPQSRAMIQKKKPRAKEDDSNARSLLLLMKNPSKEHPAPIKKASLTRFGGELPAYKARGFNFDKISTALKGMLRKKVGKKDAALLDQLEKTPKKGAKQLENYEKMRQLKWCMKTVGGSGWVEYSFESLKAIAKKLEKSSLQGKDYQDLFARLLIAPSGKLEQAKTFEEHFLDDSPLAQALNYTPSLESPSREVYIIPFFWGEDIHLENDFHKFQQQSFTYRDEDGKQHKINFNTFMANRLLEKPMLDISPPVDLVAVDNMINKMGWKVISSELLDFDKDTDMATELEDIQVKPLPDTSLSVWYVARDLMRPDLNTRFPGLIQHIMSNLTPESEQTAINAGEVQLMDFTTSNLGFAPASNSHVERFKDIIFTYDSKKYSFKDFSLLYAKGRLEKPTKLIEFTENGKKFKGPLEDFEELEAALNLKYDIVIPDFDSAIGESNHLGYRQLLGSDEIRTFLPIQSALLDLPLDDDNLWKDKPLSKETIDKLSDSTRDAEIRKWMKKDPPIFKRVSDSAKIKIEKELEFLLGPFDLSRIRHKLVEQGNYFDDLSFERLKKTFIEDLAKDPDNIKTAKLWKILEEELSSVVIRPGDTYEKIAMRTNRTVDEIRKLYPLFEFIPGQKIYLHYDLRSNSPEAQKNRIKMLNQLFPRFTSQQQNAMIERQDNRNQYLQHVKELQDSTLEGRDLLNQIKRILSDRSTPLDTIERRNLLNQCKLMAAPETDKREIEKFKKQISSLLRPTYFKVMCSMYPSLKNNYELNVRLYGKRDAGSRIGHRDFALEKVIQIGLQRGGDAAKFAKILEKEIDENPPTFLLR